MSAEASGARERTALVDRELGYLAGELVAAAERLHSGDAEDIDQSLADVAHARSRLAHVESELVGLARRSGRSWAQIGADLNLIAPRPPAAQSAATLDRAHQRRFLDGDANARRSPTV